MTRATAPRSRGVGSRVAALDLPFAASAWCCSPRRSGPAPPRRSPARRYKGRSSPRIIARPTSASSPTRSSRSSAGRSSSIRACAHRSRCCRTRRCRPTPFIKLFLSALEVHGFVALDSGNAIEIVPDANARFGEGDDYVVRRRSCSTTSALRSSCRSCGRCSRSRRTSRPTRPRTR